MKNSKPLSPHIGIYKREISSIVSISHRITGIILFFAFSFLCWAMIFWVLTGLSKRKLYYLCSMMNYKVIAIFIKFLTSFIVFNMFFHTCTGIRHLIWDMGKGLSLKLLNITGWLIVIISAFATGFSLFSNITAIEVATIIIIFFSLAIK